jgi:hypothetical protein
MSNFYRFEKEFDGVQDVFELQVCLPHGVELAASRLAPQNVV